MCVPMIFLVWLWILIFCVQSLPTPPSPGYLINCGASKDIQIGAQSWIPDDSFVSSGVKSSLNTPDLLPTLSTLRHFPDKEARKHCYVIPVTKGANYLVRTTYYYGSYDSGKHPPVFDQIVDGNRWSTVNTTEEHASGRSSYYEIILRSQSNAITLCLARNPNTSSAPFISAIEINLLHDSLYNSTDFNSYALSTIARHRFGNDPEILSFPDDQFNRFWQSFVDANPIVSSHFNVTSSDFWNVPPARAFETAITTSRGKALNVQWPPWPLPYRKYYISLYFQDNRSPSPFSWRMFNVSLNGDDFYTDLNVTTQGVTVYASEWPLSGLTMFTLTPKPGDPVGPIISAGEVLMVVPLGERTLPKDVMAMEDLARSFKNPPSDWKGDPCVPSENSWTGVSCSAVEAIRVDKLNLTGVGLSGTLSKSINNLTSLTNLLLGGNQLSGTIPEMNGLKSLHTLHLEDNQLEGSIPETLGLLNTLREIFLQDNKFVGGIPKSLQDKPGLNLRA